MPSPSITRIARLALVTGDIEAAESFFVAAFDCDVLGRGEGDEAQAALMGLPGTKIMTTLLKLGSQEISLLAFDPPGRPYPSGTGSTDLVFQHFAIIVSDMAKAYAQLQRAGRFVPVSENGPQKLPPASGAVTAFKFRDGEGHPLELLEFPDGEGPEVWAKARGTALFLGIDHSAVAVGDTAASVAFFEKGFGLSQAMQQENVGPEQSAMDAVPDARVIVTGMAPKNAPPHVELLGYQVGSRSPIDGATRSNDIAATHFVMETRDIAALTEALTEVSASFVSPGIVTLDDGALAIMVQDPDGHRFVVVQPA